MYIKDTDQTQSFSTGKCDFQSWGQDRASTILPLKKQIKGNQF